MLKFVASCADELQMFLQEFWKVDEEFEILLQQFARQTICLREFIFRLRVFQKTSARFGARVQGRLQDSCNPLSTVKQQVKPWLQECMQNRKFPMELPDKAHFRGMRGRADALRIERGASVTYIPSFNYIWQRTFPVPCVPCRQDWTSWKPWCRPCLGTSGFVWDIPRCIVRTWYTSSRPLPSDGLWE